MMVSGGVVYGSDIVYSGRGVGDGTGAGWENG